MIFLLLQVWLVKAAVAKSKEVLRTAIKVTKRNLKKVVKMGIRHVFNDPLNKLAVDLQSPD